LPKYSSCNVAEFANVSSRSFNAATTNGGVSLVTRASSSSVRFRFLTAPP
jgi:hypothetical protein